MNINCLLNYLDDPNKLNSDKIPNLYILEIIKSNHIPLIKLIFGNSNFNYMNSNFSGVFEKDSQGLYLFKGIRIKNSFILENVDDDFFKGIMNVHTSLKTLTEKRYF